jgi:glycosyltransferase involved in cell wall biosynthesis
MTPVNILHVFRAPVGGLFRHVLDLSRAQAERGHRVGLIADSNTGGTRAEDALAKLAPVLALGVTRFPMGRQIGPGDARTLMQVMRRIARAKADIVHGHGAKGGAYARVALNTGRSLRVYTPHGGSLLFGHDTLAGKFYLTTEWLMMPRGDLYLFESTFSSDMFRRKIGEPGTQVQIVHNGVSREEFEPVIAKPDATDLVFMGELRLLKGIDVLIDAIALLTRSGRSPTATLVGDGADRSTLQAQIDRLGLSAAIRLTAAMPARQAQALGRIMVVPSRIESFPYVVLESAAAGKPLIATRVGGIPEIYGPLADRLVPADNADALAGAIALALDQPSAAAEAARKLRERVAAQFSIDTMVEGVLAAYREGLEALKAAGRR